MTTFWALRLASMCPREPRSFCSVRRLCDMACLNVDGLRPPHFESPMAPILSSMVFSNIEAPFGAFNGCAANYFCAGDRGDQHGRAKNSKPHDAAGALQGLSGQCGAASKGRCAGGWRHGLAPPSASRRVNQEYTSRLPRFVSE